MAREDETVAVEQGNADIRAVGFVAHFATSGASSAITSS